MNNELKLLKELFEKWWNEKFRDKNSSRKRVLYKRLFEHYKINSLDDLKKLEEKDLKGMTLVYKNKLMDFKEYVNNYVNNLAVRIDENVKDIMKEIDIEKHTMSMEELVNSNIKAQRNNKIEIKNLYMRLIENELKLVNEKLNNQCIGVIMDEDLKELFEVYIKLRDIHY